MARLKPALDALYHQFDYAGRLEADPLGLVRAWADPADQEVVGILAAALAYGRVDLFIPKLRLIFAWMGDHAAGPAAFVRAFEGRRHGRWLEGFRYRVTSGADLGRLLEALRAELEVHGSLEAALAAGFDPGDPDIGPALTAFIARLYASGDAPTRGFKHLAPSPAGGSACKRLNLWLRWMVRRQPGVDLGIWGRIPASHLLLPLDTHSLRMAHNLGLTDRLDMSWRNAQRITRALRQLDPEDPVKYDFALCHKGMSGDCPAHRQDILCQRCELRDRCRWW